ncbi:MAG: glycosyltransferase family 2 protein [Campylobacter sp.]|nr:glycosyltransferase family 2 protein [Campylobacter sp.]
MKYKVSIVIPVYNVNKHIEKCAITLFEQDFESIEYVFVNDFTPDNSMEILSEVISRYPNRKNDIKVITHESNQGTGITRYDGVTASCCEYIIQIDSDDWIELDMISSLYKKAVEMNADIVVCDYFENYPNREIYITQPYIGSKSKNIILNQEQTIKKLLLGEVHGSVWHKFVSRNIYKKIKFPEFSYLEDKYISLQLFYFADKILYFNKAFLHYNQTNISAITHTLFSDKNLLDVKKYSDNVINFLKEKSLYENLIKYHYMGVLYIILITSYNKTLETNKNICPKAYKLKYIWKNKNFNIKSKIALSLKFFNMNFIYKILVQINRKIKSIFNYV